MSLAQHTIRSLRRPCIKNLSLTNTRTFASSPASRYLELAYDKHDVPPGAEPSKSGPIVFLHGLFGSKRNNRTMSKILARDLKRPVYALDLRNHGDSPHDPVHDYASMADDVEHFLHTHSLSQITLMGHSMGAKVAMAVALRQSLSPASSSSSSSSSNSTAASVRNLISIDNAPIDAALKSDFGKYVQGMQRIAAAAAKGEVDRLSKADAILTAVEPDSAVRQFLLTNLVKKQQSSSSSPSSSSSAVDDKGNTSTMEWRIPIGTLGKSLSHMADFPFKDPEQTRFEGPALFLRGTKSRYVADEALPVIGRFFPRFELVDVVAGHWIASENPEAFRKAVVEFLADR